MKAEEMNEMELRGLDAFCAEEVMGWKWLKFSPGNPFEGAWEMSNGGGTQGTLRYSFSPTTDRADAFEVLRRIITHDENNLLWKHSGLASDKLWFAHSTKLGPGLAAGSAPTLPLAICLLAKKIYSEKE